MRARRTTIWSVSYKIFGGLAVKIVKHFTDLGSSILKSGMKVSLEAYVSFLILVVISTTISATLITFLYMYFILGASIQYSLMITAGITLTAFIAAFGVVYSYPYLKASSFGTRIDEGLPYAVAHMAVLATAGATPEEIIRSVARIPGDPVGEFMRDIVRDIDLMGMDIVTALEKARQRSPSVTLSEFLAEIIGIVRTGGNLRDFLVSYSRTLLSTQAIKAREFAETLSTLAELFIILMVVFPLLLITMFSIMSLLGGTIMGLGLGTIMSIITYILVPILGITFLIILDALIPRGG